MVTGILGLAVLALLVTKLVPAASRTAHDGPSVDAVYAKYGDRAPIIDSRGEQAIYDGRPDEPVVDCAGLIGERTMVALVFGQSNAANTVDSGYDASEPVYAYHAGTCRKVRDAIPGASGERGSSWSRLGDRIVASGLYDTVLYVDIARGGSSILNWGPQGDLHGLLLGTLEDLRARGLSPSHVFFHQGEADCALGLPRAAYKTVLDEVLGEVRAQVGPACDISVARASLFLDPACGDTRNPACYKSCPAITAAQTAAADPRQRIFPGPNTDLLVPWFDRYDGYHFTAEAADRFAAAWMPFLVHDVGSNQTLQ